MVTSDMNLLHPVAQPKFQFLADRLKALYTDGHTKTEFRVFETYRSPLRQALVKAQGNSKAGPFDSAHQYGLAVDFVPWVVASINGKAGWSWAKSHDWDLLRVEAKAIGLLNDIPWDRAHVEHPKFAEIRRIMRK